MTAKATRWVGPRAREAIAEAIVEFGIGRLTQMLDCNRATLVGIPGGAVDPRWSTVCRASAALKLELTDWLPADSDKASPTSDGPRARTREEGGGARIEAARAKLRGDRPVDRTPPITTASRKETR